MNRLSLIIRQRIFIIVFAVLVLLGGIVIYWYTSRSENINAGDPGSQQVLMASCDIYSGVEIGEDMVGYKEIPENVYSEDFFTVREEVVGMKTNSDILKGEIISIENLEEGHRKEEEYLKFSSYIPAGLRAVSVPVNYFGDASIINSGDKVDIISTFYDNKNDMLVSVTILSGKEIILINGKKARELTDGDIGGKGNTGEISVLGDMFKEDLYGQANSNLTVITIYLKPEEAERIFLAMGSGVLNISICPGNKAK